MLEANVSYIFYAIWFCKKSYFRIHRRISPNDIKNFYLLLLIAIRIEPPQWYTFFDSQVQQRLNYLLSSLHGRRRAWEGKRICWYQGYKQRGLCSPNFFLVTVSLYLLIFTFLYTKLFVELCVYFCDLLFSTFALMKLRAFKQSYSLNSHIRLYNCIVSVKCFNFSGSFDIYVN